MKVGDKIVQGDVYCLDDLGRIIAENDKEWIVKWHGCSKIECLEKRFNIIREATRNDLDRHVKICQAKDILSSIYDKLDAVWNRTSLDNLNIILDYVVALEGEIGDRELEKED